MYLRNVNVLMGCFACRIGVHAAREAAARFSAQRRHDAGKWAETVRSGLLATVGRSLTRPDTTLTCGYGWARPEGLEPQPCDP